MRLALAIGGGCSRQNCSTNKCVTSERLGQRSDYDNRDQYLYYLSLNNRVCKDQTNVVKDVIVRHLLPIVEQSF